MRYKLKLMFSIVCLGVVAASVFGQGFGDRNRPSGRGTYKILGKVFTADGKPAVDVEVDASGGEINGQRVRTDRDGNFAISGLSSGNYTISVRVEGLPPEREVVTIPEGATSGQTYQVALHLRVNGQTGSQSKKSAPQSANFAGVPPSAVSKYEEALGYMTKDDPAKALPLFDQAIKNYDKFTIAYYERGAAQLKLKAFDKAVEDFVKALSLKPDYVEAKYGYGLAEFGLKNYPVAEAAFRDVLKEKNDMAEAHLNLGMTLFHLKNGTEAQTELQTAVTMKGGEKLALGHLYLGQIYMMKKDNANAVMELQKYLDLVPKAPNADKIRSTIDSLKKQS